MEKFSYLTKELLAEMVNFPEAHKKAIEHAIWEMTLPDDPRDHRWPNHFRAAEVNCQLECQISDDDKPAEDEYEGDCVWFGAGWKAAFEYILDGLKNLAEQVKYTRRSSL
ncbi:hypothetical protein ES703_86076 [subsurface metagenome]